MNRPIGTIRKFRTAQFTVIVDALEDYDADLSFDDTGEVRAGLESGKFTCFTARARVLHKTLGEVAADYLGGCIYENLEDFMDHKEHGKPEGAGWEYVLAYGPRGVWFEENYDREDY